MRNINTTKDVIWMRILAFLIPIGIFLFSCWQGEIYPLGDRSLVYHDMQYQYTDFFMWFHQVLQGVESWEYSFHAGLGGNTIALVAYYLASPLNFLLLLIPVEKIAQFLTLLIILKLALCGVTAFLYLEKLHLTKSIGGVFLSVGYALMGYNILQCSNVMWLDGVIILPILGIGIHKMVYEKKCGTYYPALLYAIISNWYIGYMLCIFACIYFAMEMCLFYENRKNSLKEILKSMGMFAGYSVLAAMSSCFLLFPQTLQMMKQGESFDNSVLKADIGFSYLDGFRDLYLQGGKLTQVEWIPPIFVGSFMLFLVVVFFIGRYVSRYKKVVFGGFLLGFLMFLCYKPLNYLFTGFKVPHNHYYRQAFLFGFLMLVIAGYGIKALEQKKIEQAAIWKGVAIIVGIGLFFDMIHNYEPRTGVYKSCLFVILIGSVCAYQWKGLRIRRIGGVLIFVCMVLEFSTKLSWEFEDHTQSVSHYTNYNQAMRAEIESLKREDDAFDIYRLDKTLTRSTSDQGFGNESMSFGYSSIAQYASTDDLQMKEVLVNVGYGNDLKHLTYYPILPMDSVLGVKYIYSRGNIYQGKLMKEDVLEDIRLYENPYALPVAFEIDKGCDEIKWSDDAFANHEMFFDAVTGDEVGLYSTPQISESSTDGKSWKTWRLKIVETGPVYLYFKHENPDMKVWLNNQVLESFSWFNNHVMYAGEFKKGDTVEVKVTDGMYMEDYGFVSATLRMDHFEKVISLLKEKAIDNGIQKKKFFQTTYKAEEDGRMMFTIPYDEGWKISVNQEEKELQKVAGDFMAVEIEKGENIIELRYTAPGLRVGRILSVIGVIGFVALEYVRKKEKPKLFRLRNS